MCAGARLCHISIQPASFHFRHPTPGALARAPCFVYRRKSRERSCVGVRTCGLLGQHDFIFLALVLVLVLMLGLPVLVCVLVLVLVLELIRVPFPGGGGWLVWTIFCPLIRVMCEAGDTITQEIPACGSCACLASRCPRSVIAHFRTSCVR